jgi:membrane peptidoglycan carboxypeptidase
MLEVVVTDGTARDSKLAGYRAAGKTGTAQKIDETGRYGSKFVASFAGYAPVSNPSLALVVVVDEPSGAYYGAQVAAPIFKNIAEQVLRYKSVAPDVPFYAPEYKFPADATTEAQNPKSESTVDSASMGLPPETGGNVPPGLWRLASSVQGQDSPELGGIIIPDFYGKALREVTEAALKAGLRLQSTGSGAAVEQLPPPGASVRPGSRVTVRFSTRVLKR